MTASATSSKLPRFAALAASLIALGVVSGVPATPASSVANASGGPERNAQGQVWPQASLTASAQALDGAEGRFWPAVSLDQPANAAPAQSWPKMRF